jgi:hypothetical protein
MDLKAGLHKREIINFFNNFFNAIIKPIGAEFVLYFETDRISIQKSFLHGYTLEPGRKLRFFITGKAGSRSRFICV